MQRVLNKAGQRRNAQGALKKHAEPDLEQLPGAGVREAQHPGRCGRMDAREAEEFAKIAQRLEGELDLRALERRRRFPHHWVAGMVLGLAVMLLGMQIHLLVSFLGVLLMFTAGVRLADPVSEQVRRRIAAGEAARRPS